MHNELTPRDIAKMQEEIEYRKVTVRKELLEHVKEARAHGDLSENFEYHAAKREKNKNESRIRFLERMIKTAVVISDETEEGKVGVNSRVTVTFPDDCSEEVYTIVTTVRGNSLKGFISVESPMGKALLNHEVGDKVTVIVNTQVSYPVIIKKIESIEDENMELNRF